MLDLFLGVFIGLCLIGYIELRVLRAMRELRKEFLKREEYEFPS